VEALVNQDQNQVQWAITMAQEATVNKIIGINFPMTYTFDGENRNSHDLVMGVSLYINFGYQNLSHHNFVSTTSPPIAAAAAS